MCRRSILFLALTTVAASIAAPADVDQILGENPSLKTKVFNQCVLPVITVGAETWTRTVELVHKFIVAQMLWTYRGRVRIGPADLSSTEPIVLPKRAALVLDRLLVALQNALREEVEGLGEGAQGASVASQPGERGEVEGISAPAALRARTVYDDYTAPSAVLADETGRTMDLQRRGHSSGGRGRVLRCYFNAVTCFRK